MILYKTNISFNEYIVLNKSNIKKIRNFKNATSLSKNFEDDTEHFIMYNTNINPKLSEKIKFMYTRLC